MTFQHVTLRGKWHFIFYLQTISGEALWLMHVPPGTCVLLKEPPINLWALPINANRPLIISSLNQPSNICSDKLSEPQNDLTSFYIAAYQDLLWDPAVSLWLHCIAFRLIHVSSLLFCSYLLWLCVVVVVLYLFFSILSFFAVSFHPFVFFFLAVFCGHFGSLCCRVVCLGCNLASFKWLCVCGISFFCVVIYLLILLILCLVAAVLHLPVIIVPLFTVILQLFVEICHFFGVILPLSVVISCHCGCFSAS